MFVTSKGSLNIRYAEPVDSGTYTCMGMYYPSFKPSLLLEKKWAKYLYKAFPLLFPVRNSKATIQITVKALNNSFNEVWTREEEDGGDDPFDPLREINNYNNGVYGQSAGNGHSKSSYDYEPHKSGMYGVVKHKPKNYQDIVPSTTDRYAATHSEYTHFLKIDHFIRVL